MAIFAIIRQPHANSALLDSVIAETYPQAHYDLGDGAWLIAEKATAQEVADRLQITNGNNGSALVLEAASYFGRANPAIWTWMKANWEGPVNG